MSGVRAIGDTGRGEGGEIWWPAVVWRVLLVFVKGIVVMLVPTGTKFGFCVRTRSGGIVERILILSKSEVDAELKLRQMYRNCIVLRSWQETPAAIPAHTSFEDIVDLINA